MFENIFTGDNYIKFVFKKCVFISITDKKNLNEHTQTDMIYILMIAV